MTAPQTKMIQSRQGQYPIRPEPATISVISDHVRKTVDDHARADSRKLRNRLILINVAAWIVIIVCARLIFF